MMFMDAVAEGYIQMSSTKRNLKPVNKIAYQQQQTEQY